ncbi:MAG TPA: SusD/RagB family nutrient-binding outer membrane lipoprotein [Cyclobacteriaceae bacterium]|nr:SusD/RagB family nutrient-binding outer membrane lipoprotein [Cyclobacteriaceae bacterium]
MNLRKISKVLFVLPVTLVLGCSDFLDINDSPNSPVDVPLSAIMGPAIGGAAFANANELNRFGAVVSDYLYGAAGSPRSYDTYVLTGGDFGNQWTGELWNGPLIMFDKIIKKGTEQGNFNYVGVAKIMQAYTWSLVTDVWGDIPYSEALRGETADGGIYRPKVDSQESIYKGSAEKPGLFALIREGIADLDKGTNLPLGADDVVYGGNIALWKRAGYTLMLRLATTISVKDPEYAKSIFNEVLAVNGGAWRNTVISNNSHNLSVKFGGALGSQSPTYTYMFVSLFMNELIVSKRFTDLLQNNTPTNTTDDDPRLPVLVKKGQRTPTDPTPTADWVVFENGSPPPTVNPVTFSKWNTAVVGANGVGPVRLVTNAGRAFMMAEAILRLGITVPGETAQTLYYEGIRASMDEYGTLTDAAFPLTSAAATAYIGASSATATTVAKLAGSVDQQINQIITQKYIAMAGNGLEAWNDIRRTGFPAHTQPEHQAAAGEDGKRPVRARYPDADIARNPNLGAAVKKTNEKMWWDAN